MFQNFNQHHWTATNKKLLWNQNLYHSTKTKTFIEPKFISFNQNKKFYRTKIKFQPLLASVCMNEFHCQPNVFQCQPMYFNGNQTLSTKPSQRRACASPGLVFTRNHSPMWAIVNLNNFIRTSGVCFDWPNIVVQVFPQFKLLVFIGGDIMHGLSFP